MSAGQGCCEAAAICRSLLGRPARLGAISAGGTHPDRRPTSAAVAVSAAAAAARSILVGFTGAGNRRRLLL
jgi:hypothetical protein